MDEKLIINSIMPNFCISCFPDSSAILLKLCNNVNNVTEVGSIFHFPKRSEMEDEKSIERSRFSTGTKTLNFVRAPVDTSSKIVSTSQ